jgi:hypothetical protein
MAIRMPMPKSLALRVACRISRQASVLRSTVLLLKPSQNGLSNTVPQEHKEVVREKVEQGRKVLVEDYFPEDRRGQFIYRIKKVT